MRCINLKENDVWKLIKSFSVSKLRKTCVDWVSWRWFLIVWLFIETLFSFVVEWISRILIGVLLDVFCCCFWNDNEIEGKMERRYRVFASRVYLKRRVTACWWSIIIYLCRAIHVVIISQSKFIELSFGVFIYYRDNRGPKCVISTLTMLT